MRIRIRNGSAPMALAAACLLAVGSSPAAHAAPPKGKRAALDDAEDLAARAQAEFKAGAFEQAARMYMKAYGKSGKPSVVYNAARAYEEAGNLGEAVALFRLYLSLDPDADGVMDARARLQKLEALRVGKAPVAPDAAATPAPGTVTAPPVASMPAAPGEPSGVVRASGEPPPAGSGVPWAVAGGSAAVAVAGAVLMFQGAADSEAAKGLTVHSKADYAAYETAHDAASTRWAVGAGLAVAGVVGAGVGVWLLLRPSKPAAQAVVPIAVPGGAGLAWSRSW